MAGQGVAFPAHNPKRNSSALALRAHSEYYHRPWYRALAKPGEQLRDIRLRLGITVREVAEESQKIAEIEGNPEFAISESVAFAARKFQLRAQHLQAFQPEQHLPLQIHRSPGLFGVDLQRLPERQLSTRLPNTHLVTVEDPDPEKTVSFPIQFDRGFNSTTPTCCREWWRFGAMSPSA